MRASLPFIYTANVVMGRKKNPQEVQFFDVVSVDIPEIETAHAPVGLVWREGRSAQRNEVRLHDGGFYVPASRMQRDASGFPVSMLADLKTLSEQMAQSIGTALGYKIGSPEWHAIYRYTGPKAETPPGRDDIKKLESSGEAAARARAEAVAEGLISIDGIVYRKVEEPVIAVHCHLDAGQPNVKVSVFTGPRRYNAPLDLDQDIFVADPHNTRFFSVLEAQDALDHADSLGLPVISGFDEVPEVVIPDVFAFDRRFDAAERTAEFAVEGLKAGIARFDRETIEHWVDVREEYYRYLETGSREIVENLASEALPRLFELVGRTDQSAATALEAGLGDWDEGTISVPVFGDGNRP